jgi:tRNA A-37 threonylcarbamoyl transferase component Bud32
MANPEPGTSIGPYAIEGTIGAGSMGDVFRGMDVHLNRKVALKILSEKHRDSPELRARFVREGRAVAAIQHPNVVQVFATGTFDERPYIAMELLDGTDLGTLVDEHGPLSSLTAARMVLDAARGLHAAARAGLIHRDVKPSNLVQLTDGRVKVTDFGLAKPVDPGSEPALTALGVVVGTPDYIAPEQARGDEIDERVDIYALGGTLYYLLVGIPPFRTGKPAEDKYLKVVARHLRQPPPDPRTARPEVDDDLAELARAMMAKKPGERPEYATLVARLEAITARLAAGTASGSVPYPRAAEGSGGMIAKTPFVGGDVPNVFRDGEAAGGSGAALAPRPGLPRWVIAATILSALLLAAGAVVYVMRGGDRAPAAPGSAAPASPDAAPAPPDAVPPPAEPVPPEGMALVKRADGSPWFFVDREPVRHGAYAQVFPKQKKPSPALDAQPVTGVAYNFARAYAQSAERRLLSAAEYDAALTTAGVEAAPAPLWEWVDEGDDARRTVRAPGKTARRAQTGQKDVTFRLAADLP